VGHSFKNFSVWRGRLPHWRADDVTYYVTFRHRRALDSLECNALLRALIRPDARKWNLIVACVLPEATELIFVVRESAAGMKYELSKVVEKAKNQVGKAIQKRTAERYPPFYAESLDRIIRDEAEYEARMFAIMKSPIEAELVEKAGDYQALYVADNVEAPMPARTSGKTA
jgi:hypothetical protein